VLAEVKEAIGHGAIGLDAVRHLVLCRIERRPSRLDAAAYSDATLIRHIAAALTSTGP
jgi:hypothetical protein